MNTFINSPAVARAFTRQIIAERVRDAEERQAARDIRRERRAAARAARASQPQPNAPWLPGTPVRFPRPAH